MSMSSETEFNASIFVSEQLTRQLVNSAQDLAHRCVYECASKYGFDAEEAVRFLGLSMVKMVRKAPLKEKVAKKAKVEMPKPAFPLPYSGEFAANNCYALRQNNGLYTQCTGLRKGDEDYCKGCASQMKKTGADIPEYGTIQQRMAVGILEFVDPKGRKPVAYTKVMKKYKISKEQVLEEAGKFSNYKIDDVHFVETERDGKRGRPASKVEKEVKVKGVKGRPKKEKKVLQIEGDDDLFATLVAQANIEDDKEEIVVKGKKSSGKSEEEKEAERQEKEAKRKAAEQAKAEKEAKLAAEKAEKEAKKEEERLAREAKKKAEEEEKLAKKLALEKAKAEKEEKLAAEKAAKEAAKAQKASSSKKAAKKEEPEEEEEPDVVKKIEFEGKKYLKSKKTGIVYDYTEYLKHGEQVVVGKWNENTNKIDFENDGEESEEEYDT